MRLRHASRVKVVQARGQCALRANRSRAFSSEIDKSIHLHPDQTTIYAIATSSLGSSPIPCHAFR